MFRKIASSLVFVLVGLLVSASDVAAIDPLNTTTLGNRALKGFDAVAYFLDGKAIKGSKKFEHEWQEANLDSIRHYPITPCKILSNQPLGSVSRQFYDPRKRVIYAAINYPGEFAHIAKIDIDTGN